MVDIDDSTETPRDRLDFVLDKEKAALHGVTTEMITHTLRMAVAGISPATVHAPGERQALSVTVILPRAQRSTAQGLTQIPIKTASGQMVALGELGFFQRIPVGQPIYHKNLKPVVYVFGEMAGRGSGGGCLGYAGQTEE